MTTFTELIEEALSCHPNRQYMINNKQCQFLLKNSKDNSPHGLSGELLQRIIKQYGIYNIVPNDMGFIITVDNPGKSDKCPTCGHKTKK